LPLAFRGLHPNRQGHQVPATARPANGQSDPIFAAMTPIQSKGYILNRHRQPTVSADSETPVIDQVISGAEGAFLENGYAPTSMDSLARQAGVPRRSVEMYRTVVTQAERFPELSTLFYTEWLQPISVR
jgi:hypothetical protein